MTKKKDPKDYNPSGRPTLYKDHFEKDVYNACLLGATNKELAKKLNVNLGTINLWIETKPKFMDAIKAGREIADEKVAKSMYKTAIDGNTTAQIFWLKNRHRDKWRDKHEVEQSGKVEVTMVNLDDL